MGTPTVPYGLYIPAQGEPGATWGDPVGANFQQINDDLLANSNAIVDETTARSNAVSSEASARVAADAALQTSITAGDTATLTAAQAYVDAVISNRQTKQPVRFVTTTNIALSGLGALSEGTPVATDRILVAGQTTGSQNGIYVAASGAWTRSTDADATGELLEGCVVWVSEGSTFADSGWELSTDGVITIGTTAQTWTNYYKGGLYATAAALTAETSARTTADTTLQTNINANTTAIASETTARTTADALLTISLTEAANVFIADFAPAADSINRVDTTSNNVIATLPTAPPNKTRVCIKHIIQGGTNVVTYNTGGSDVINKAGGVTTGSLPVLGQAVTLQYRTTGAIWTVVSNDIPLSSLDLRYGSGITRRAVSGTVTAAFGDDIVADTTGGAFAITLPAASNVTAQIIVTNIGTSLLTLTGTVSGIVNPTLAQWDSRIIRSTASVLFFV